jgi:hypothetical protein
MSPAQPQAGQAIGLSSALRSPLWPAFLASCLVLSTPYYKLFSLLSLP